MICMEINPFLSTLCEKHKTGAIIDYDSRPNKKELEVGTDHITFEGEVGAGRGYVFFPARIVFWLSFLFQALV